MSENFGTGVSFVSDPSNYNYDTVVFQKGKPPLDTELNLLQQIQNDLAHRRLENIASGWLSFRHHYTSPLLNNSFYTQEPTTATPEYALVNGMPVFVTNTATSEANANLINLPGAPLSGSQVNGVFLEVWRALLSPMVSDNKPDPVMAIDSLMGVHAISKNVAWGVGENGLILHTENAGETWNVQIVDTKQVLRSVFFVNSAIGWAVGDNGVIARTSSGGARWSLLYSGYTMNLSGVHAASQQLAWVVGDNGLILKTINGINWSVQHTSTTTNLRSIHFIDTQSGWVCGDNGTILWTNDAGGNWVAQQSGVSTKLNSIYFYDARTGFAVGDGGLILGTSNGGTTWYPCTSNTTVDLTDVTMAPALDEQVVGEDVTSQFTGSNKTCVLMHNPITKGDGNGVVTNLPSDVKVYVNDVEVGVDAIDGVNGIIVLNQAPARCASVKVTYWYKISTAIFRGKAWVTGKNGTVLESDNLGTTWVAQDPQTAYDVNAVYMVSPNNGWIVGQFSKIRHTTDGGTTWVEQLPDVIARQVQRVYSEGNVKTVTYLNDNSLHPDLAIETTKRIQVQYRIRVVDNVDPFSYPDAGLGSTSITGYGPGDSGTDAFKNMGSTTGDYGLWRAKCNGTVDGYTYAIPMFLVGRRNTSDFNSSSNVNGSTSNTAVRPDLLTASNIINADILDVRRKVLVQSTSQLLDDNFEALLDNSLDTRFFRDVVGGDRYGVEVLQLDQITGSELSTAADGFGSTVSVVVPEPYTVPATASLPSNPISINIIGGVSHQNPSHYTAFYKSADPLYDGRTVPGTFSGYGTPNLTFTFNATANTVIEDPQLDSYKLSYTAVFDSTAALKRVPSEPKLVSNYSNSGTYHYNGVFEQETTGRVISQWASNITNFNNKSVVYPVDGSDTSTVMCSPVEVHLFVMAGSDVSQLVVNLSDFHFPVLTVSRVNNVTSGYSYKISDVVVTASTITIVAEAGYSFVSGSIYEVVGMAKTVEDSVNTGSSVNFKRSEKKLSTFCVSDVLETTATPSSITMQLSNGTLGITGNILGVSSIERKPLYGEIGIILPVCWIDEGNGYKIHPIKVTSKDGNSVEFDIYDWNGDLYNYGGSVRVRIQVMAKQTSLFYTDSNSTTGLQIAYYYKAYQSVSDLPSTLTLQIAERPKNLIVSDLGTGGSLLNKEPFDLPLQNIPVNDSIADDDAFFNIEPLQFGNFSIDGGLAQLPMYVPGNLSGLIVLSNPVSDVMGRYYYKTCSKDFVFRTEGLQMAAPRKIFCGAMAQVVSSSDQRFLKNEYVMIVFSRNDFLGTDNYVKYGDKSVVAVYRLPNRPIVRT